MLDRDVEAAILAAVDGASAGRSIALDPLAAIVAPEDPASAKVALLDAARRLAAAGAIELLAAGKAVDPAQARGPLEIRRRRR